MVLICVKAISKTMPHSYAKRSTLNYFLDKAKNYPAEIRKILISITLN